MSRWPCRRLRQRLCWRSTAAGPSASRPYARPPSHPYARKPESEECSWPESAGLPQQALESHQALAAQEPGPTCAQQPQQCNIVTVITASMSHRDGSCWRCAGACALNGAGVKRRAAWAGPLSGAGPPPGREVASPAPTCSTASGCAASTGALTPASSCGTPTRYWTRWAWRRSPNGPGAS